jgi:hypothetical protein
MEKNCMNKTKIGKLPENLFMPYVATAVVVLAAAAHWIVKLDNGMKSTASCAASCLLCPNVGDSVLCVQLENQVVILAILKQADSTQQHYNFAAQCSLTCADNTAILAAKHLTIESKQQINRVDHVQNFHSTVLNEVELHQLSAGTMVESVRELKQQVLGDLHTFVQEDYRIEAKRALIYGEEFVNVDGKQINLN